MSVLLSNLYQTLTFGRWCVVGGRSYVSCVSMGFLKGWYYDGILEGMVLCTLLTNI